MNCFKLLNIRIRGFFNTRFEKDYIKILQNRYNRTKQKFYGFETKTIYEAHLSKDFLNLNFTFFLDKLEALGFKKFNLLKRRNLLKQLISVERRIQNEQFHFHDKIKIKGNKIIFDPNEVTYGNYKGDMFEIFIKLEKQYKFIGQELNTRKIDFLTLYYEDDIEKDPLDAYQKICKFCKIPLEKVIVKQHKIGKKDMMDEIQNLEKLINYLNGTPYEWMIQQ